MNLKKEFNEILNGILELPLPLQGIVAQDIIESAKSRIETIKRIVVVA